MSSLLPSPSPRYRIIFFFLSRSPPLPKTPFPFREKCKLIGFLFIRYAWFYDGPGYLIANDYKSLSAQGIIYNSYT